jgi:hypothetical protein
MDGVQTQIDRQRMDADIFRVGFGPAKAGLTSAPGQLKMNLS